MESESPLNPPQKTSTTTPSSDNKKECRHKLKQHKKKIPKDLHSCHVSPLPINVTKHELVKLFQEYEDLSDVFISQRAEKADKYTFGFVRFKSKESANHAVQCVSRSMNGIPIVVSHSKNILVSPKDDSESKPDKPELDRYFANAFKETWESFDDSDKTALDSILTRIRSKKQDNFNPESPSCAFSVDITETTIANIDYKRWRTFFREQNDISKSLTEISRNPVSQDTKNLSKCDSTQSKSLEEKEAEISLNTKEISHSTPTSPLEKEDEGFGSHCTSEPESLDVTGPNYGPQITRKLELESSSADCDDDDEDDEDYSSENLPFEEEEPRKNVTIFAAQSRHERNLPLKNSYPMGRGKGLMLACQNTDSPTQFYRNLRKSDLRLSIEKTNPQKADIDESQFPNQRNILQVPNVYSDSRSSHNHKANVIGTKSSLKRCKKFADQDVNSLDLPQNRHSYIPVTHEEPVSNQGSFDFRQIRTELKLRI